MGSIGTEIQCGEILGEEQGINVNEKLSKRWIIRQSFKI